MRTILSLFLAAVLALSSGKAIPDGKTAPGVNGSLAGANWADVPYEHIDPAGFYEQVEQLTALAEAGEEKRVLDLFDDLTAQLLRMDTMDTMAYLNYSAAVTDEYWSEENLYNDEMLTEAADALCEAAHDLTQGPCAQAFAKHVGRDAAASYADYVPLTDRESELLVQESELVDQYFEAMAAQDEMEFEYDGRTWTFEMLDGPAGSALADTDYSAYVDVYYGLQKALNDVVGSIFTQLVAIRSELAEIEGYDSYADLAYEKSFGRDYTGEEAQALLAARLLYRAVLQRSVVRLRSRGAGDGRRRASGRVRPIPPAGGRGGRGAAGVHDRPRHVRHRRRRGPDELRLHHAHPGAGLPVPVHGPGGRLLRPGAAQPRVRPLHPRLLPPRPGFSHLLFRLL